MVAINLYLNKIQLLQKNQIGQNLKEMVQQVNYQFLNIIFNFIKGLSMKILKEDSEKSEKSSKNNEINEFTFEHSKEYQQIQFQFIDAVESLDHNNIIVY